MKKTFFVLLFILLVFPSLVRASAGVGIQPGKITVDEKLIPGGTYQLPPFTISNTGDTASEYTVGVSYIENQRELKPDISWFSFSSSRFTLAPGTTQVVTAHIILPLNAVPGNYFSFVEGSPVKTSTQGKSVVSVAAATKVYFTVISTNIFVGMYYRIFSLYKLHGWWIQSILVTILIFASVDLFRRFYRVSINRKRKTK